MNVEYLSTMTPSRIRTSPTAHAEAASSLAVSKLIATKSNDKTLPSRSILFTLIVPCCEGRVWSEGTGRACAFSAILLLLGEHEVDTSAVIKLTVSIERCNAVAADNDGKDGDAVFLFRSEIVVGVEGDRNVLRVAA